MKRISMLIIIIIALLVLSGSLLFLKDKNEEKDNLNNIVAEINNSIDENIPEEFNSIPPTPGLNPNLENFFEFTNDNKTEELFNLIHKNATIIDFGRTFQGKDEIIQWIKDEIIGSHYIIKSREYPDNNQGSFELIYSSDKSPRKFTAYYDLRMEDDKLIHGYMEYQFLE